MTESVSLKEMPLDFKIALLRELGYDSDGTFVIEKNGKKHEDRYTNEPIRLDNMVILPGSTVILDNNPLSITSFLEEFCDVI